MQLRPYQQEAVAATVKGFYEDGIHLQGQSWPCGTGKTVYAANLYSALGMLPGESILFLAHRDELITQAANKFRFYNPELSIGIEKAEYKSVPDADVIVASVQSMTPARIKKFDPDRVRVVFVDETHHAAQSATYQRILEHFHVHRSRESLSHQKLLVGLSATWKRGDKIGYEHLYEKIVFHRSIRDIMRQGITVAGEWCPYLAPIRGHRELSELNLDRLKVDKGKFRDDDLAKTMNTPERNNQAVDAYLEKGGGMPLIGFSVDIQHSIDLAKAFRDRGLQVEAVSGDKKRTGDRAPVMKAFEDGQLLGLISCAAIEEGTDLPRASVGINACPTLSPVKYCQKFGRISRPFPAPEERLSAHEAGRSVPWVKPYGVWIDLTDSSTKHSLVQMPSLFGLRPDFDLRGKDVEETMQAIEEAKAADPSLEVSQLKSLDDLARKTITFAAVENPTESVEIRKWSSYPWVEEADGQWALIIRGTNSVIRVRKQTDREFEVWAFHMGAGMHRGNQTTLRQAVMAAEKLLDKKEKKLLQRDAPWRREAPTPPQCRRVWEGDPNLRQQFRQPDRFFVYAHDQWEKGNSDFNKGAIADILNSYMMAARPQIGHRMSNILRSKASSRMAAAVAGAR